MEERYYRNRVLQKNRRYYPKHKKGLTATEVKRLVVLFIIAAVAGAIAGGIMAAVVLPIAYAERGYYACGSEWILIFAAAYAGFSVFNNYIFGTKKSRKERR